MLQEGSETIRKEYALSGAEAQDTQRGDDIVRSPGKPGAAYVSV